MTAAKMVFVRFGVGAKHQFELPQAPWLCLLFLSVSVTVSAYYSSIQSEIHCKHKIQDCNSNKRSIDRPHGELIDDIEE